LTRSVDIVICRPRTVSVLSVRAVMFMDHYGGSSAERTESCRKNTVESRRFLWINVAGDAWRAAGVGLSWSIWQRSC